MKRIKTFESFLKPAFFNDVKNVILFDWDMAREEVKQWINDNWNVVDCEFLDIEDFKSQDFGDKDVNCFINYESCDNLVKNEINKIAKVKIHGSSIDLEDLQGIEVQ